MHYPYYLRGPALVLGGSGLSRGRNLAARKKLTNLILVFET